MWKLLSFLPSILVGLFVVFNQSDARAVNISNTWTMPQEGLNVFYRFFRDKISWFEADAVCQFHHANLATVDNSFQFDATGDLLKELDVTDIVWIGLMRPQNSERFMWSTSGPLATDTGYWADSLPLMDAPLCAVIDPIRDYRWHALRCGGPETASFLCEMSVPRWAEACIIKDTPSLTIQYMADTASIELIKDCGDEGIKREMCQGKLDRERIIRGLACKNEQLPQPKQSNSNLLDTHFKSLQKIMRVPTNNNEDNSIDAKPKTINIDELSSEKNPVQKLIEQFNVEDLVQSEQHLSGYHIPGEIPKPVKKVAKKAMSSDGKKDPLLQKLLNDKAKGKMPIPLEDMMMGDQPIDDDVTNEILQPIPHIKKVLPRDFVQYTEVATTVKPESFDHIKTTITSISNTNSNAETTIGESGTTTSKLNLLSADQSESPKEIIEIATATISPPQIDIRPATIGHPMHPQQPRSNIITEETTHPHIKETNDNHFIPPMLLVKSHYQPPKPHERQERIGTTTTEHSDASIGIADFNSEIKSQATAQPKTNKSTANIDLTSVSTSVIVTSEPFVTNELIQTTTLSSPTPLINDDNHHAQMNIENLPAAVQTTTAKQLSVVETILTEPSLTANEPKWTSSAPTDILATTIETSTQNIDSIQDKITNLLKSSKKTEINHGEESSTIPINFLPIVMATITTTKLHSIPSTTATTTATTTIKTNESFTTTINSNANTNENNNNNYNSDENKKTAGIALSSSTTHHNIIAAPNTTQKPTTIRSSSQTPQRNNFSDEDNFETYKPNRRRALTKPETASYFKKILG